MSGFKRLTPVVPGESGVFLLGAKTYTGFASGGPVDDSPFPQWAKEVFGGDKAHYFKDLTGTTDKRSACGRIFATVKGLFLPGNHARCKFCERIVSAEIRRRAR